MWQNAVSHLRFYIFFLIMVRIKKNSVDPYCIVRIKNITIYVYLKMIWYHNGGYFQVIFYDQLRFCADKITEHGEYAGPKIGLWYVIEQILDIEGIYRDCMIFTCRGFFEIQINHRFFLWWLAKKCDVICDIDKEIKDVLSRAPNICSQQEAGYFGDSTHSYVSHLPEIIISCYSENKSR